jgi:hypothetical protein
MWYRLTFDAARVSSSNGNGTGNGNGTTLLHFGAIDWQSIVLMNGVKLGQNTGGYNGFTYDVAAHLKPAGNELLVFAHDPSDTGAQPNGKQRISAIDLPGGDTYTPSSGIWQTVWMEAVPPTYISSLSTNQASTTAVTIAANLGGAGAEATASLSVRFDVMANSSGKSVVVASATGAPGANVTINVPAARLWHPTDPHLYDVRVTLVRAGHAVDVVTGYFGLRTFTLGADVKGTGKRPLLNGKFTFLAGFLDQSWWPDGLYTAPTDDALAFDIKAVAMFGLNMIRLHQKVNPERWYYHADKLGVVVFQDMVQKGWPYNANESTAPLFLADLRAMITGPRSNHPSVVQWDIFNEDDCWKRDGFDVNGTVAMVRGLSGNRRLINTNSGGGANDFHIGDVNDDHSYSRPLPAHVVPWKTQYSMLGEFGGQKFGVVGKEWMPGSCFNESGINTASDMADSYIAMAETLQTRVAAEYLSASVYTQTTDVELECDGFLNFDRSAKFGATDVARIKQANENLINAAML